MQEVAGEQLIEDSIDLEELILGDEQIHPAGHDLPTSSKELPSTTTSNKTPSRPHKRINKTDALLDTIHNHLKKPKIEDDKYEILAKNIAIKMKEMANDTQRLLAEKIINETLFMGTLGELTRSQNVVNTLTALPTPYFFPSEISLNKPSLEAGRSDISDESLTSYVIHISDD